MRGVKVHPEDVERGAGAGIPGSGRGQLVHTRCVQLPLAHLDEAVSIFSAKNEAGEVPLVLIPERPCGLRTWMTIPDGVHCLLQRWGADAGLARPGFDFYMPWWRVAYVVTRQSCTYNAPVKACPTSDNVMVEVDVTLVFSIRDATSFVYNLGATKFDAFLTGAVEEGIRLLVREQPHTEVYNLRGNRAGNMLEKLNRKFDDAGVLFTDCKVTSVWLPRELARSLESTTLMRNSIATENKGHEFKMMKINQESEMSVEEITRKNEQLVVQEQGKKKRAEMEHEQQVIKAQEGRRIAVISATERANVAKYEAEANLRRAQNEASKIEVEMITRAKADAQELKVRADLEAEMAEVEAQASLNAAMNDAESVRLQAAAEAESAKHLEQKRRFEAEMKEKGILSSFAATGKFNLIGETGDVLINAVMTGNFAAHGRQQVTSVLGSIPVPAQLPGSSSVGQGTDTARSVE